eukprot:gene9041-10341_t
MDTRAERKLVAEKDYDDEAIVFSEEPLVACQETSHPKKCGYLACSQCLRSLEKTDEMASRLSGQPVQIPYPELCPNKDHEITTSLREFWLNGLSNEVDVYFYIHRFRNVHHPPETTSAMLILRLLCQLINILPGYSQKQKDPATLEAFELLCHHTQVDSGQGEVWKHKLLESPHQDHIFAMQPLFIDIVNYISSDHDTIEANKWLTNNYENLWALVGLNSLGIASSVISLYDARLTSHEMTPAKRQENKPDFALLLFSDSGEFLDAEGTGLYLRQSACNHSCEPNAECKFLHGDSRVTLKATSDITLGNEIFISYLSEDELCQSRNDRWQLLRRGYLFECQCPKCERQASNPDEHDRSDEFDDSYDDSHNDDGES